MPALMDTLRLSIRLPVFVTFLLTCVTTILALRIARLFLPRPIDRAPWAKRYLSVLCRLLGFTLRRQGEPTADAALMVSNHISWIDIAVLGPAFRYVSCRKARWPTGR